MALCEHLAVFVQCLAGFCFMALCEHLAVFVQCLAGFCFMALCEHLAVFVQCLGGCLRQSPGSTKQLFIESVRLLRLVSW